MMTTVTTVMTKLALRQFPILGISYGVVNIMITIAIHCHSQRFLESESLVLPCFIYASSGDRQCITLGESL